jgi:hypothetical protein
MKKAEVITIIANGSKPLVRTKLADGRYFGTKENDDYVVLQKSGDSWAPLESVKDASKAEPIIILSDCKDAKTGAKRTIAVNEDYMAWPLGSGFSFEVVKGRTNLNLATFDKAQMKKLIAEEVN